MNPLKFIKSFIFWETGRKGWRFDFLCTVYIAALVFLPFNSNGWFNDGEKISLNDGSELTLRRVETNLFLTWSKDAAEPDREAIDNFVSRKFGEGSLVTSDPKLGTNSYRIIPRGWK